MLDDVTSRLADFGYTVTADDDFGLTFLMTDIENRIKNTCNVLTIPTELHEVAVDMVVGDFLFTKKSTGRLTDIDITAIAKKIQEGDTTVEFSVDGTPESRLDALIHYLQTRGKNDLLSFRKFRW